MWFVESRETEVTVAQATRQAILEAALSTPKAKRSLAASMIQPLRRTMGYSSIGSKLFLSAFEKGWLCSKCWLSGTQDGQTMESCPSCSGELERQDVPDGVLWVYDHEILERRIL
jgi:hypothetical protein